MTRKAVERELKPWAQAERDDFYDAYGYRGNCSCHISPPCGSCTHPGNPHNQENDDDAWGFDLDYEANAAKDRLKRHIERDVQRHLNEMKAKST
jgi:hypothetical protein